MNFPEHKAQYPKNDLLFCYLEIDSILSSASLANCASWFGTLIWFTIFPFSRFSSDQARCCGSIRAMVEHIQTIGDMNCTILLWALNSSAILPTRFNSVPTNHLVPGAESRIVLIMYSVEPT